jgi:hypothetical protein
LTIIGGNDAAFKRTGSLAVDRGRGAASQLRMWD